MEVLVTGATGFIGRYLVENLIKNGYNVKVITRNSYYKDKNIDIFFGDITKKETIADAFKDVQAVFHNAAYAVDWNNKNELDKVNIKGTRNIADLCKEKKIRRLIFTSSAGVYGFPNSNKIIYEDNEKKPFNYYHKSKLESEYILQKYNELDVSIIRPCLVFGAGGNAVKLLLKRIEQNKMKFIGTPNMNISLVHPADVAQCLRLALEKDKENNVFNVISFTCTVKELINEITNQMGIEPIKKHVPYILAYLNAFFDETFSKNEPTLTRFRVKSFGTNRIISNRKAIDKLGFKPVYNLYDMVKDMVTWYKKF